MSYKVKKIVTTFALFLSLSFMLVIVLEVQVAAAKTLVVPDDYPTITAAIRNAVDGDTIFVKNGTYEERTLEINKRLSLIGEGAEFTKINLDPPLWVSPPDAIGRSSSWFNHSIAVDANDFKLTGFTINIPNIVNTPGGAISITGNNTQIMGNNITTKMLVYSSYSKIAENTFSKLMSVHGSYCNISANRIIGGNGIYVVGIYNDIFSNSIAGGDTIDINIEGAFCRVYDNNMTKNSGISSIYVSGDGNTIARNFIDHSRIGIIMGGSDNIIYANRITNSETGLVADSKIYNHWEGAFTDSGGSNIFYANHVANNMLGADINPHPENNVTSILYHNNFISNTHQVAAADRIVYGTDSFDNGKEGNYWSDYTGKDDNGDGIGDTPYVIDANRTDRYPLMAPFDISTISIELPEWASPAPSSTALAEPEQPTNSPLITTETTIIAAAVAIVGIAAIIFKRRGK